MNTQNTDTPDTPRPFGYWITAVDRLMAAEFTAAFERESASRRDWRLLNVIDGTVAAHRPLRPHKLHDLVERGWIAQDGDGWTLTDEGRAAKERLGAAAAGIRATIADAVSPEDFETMVATLEKVAVALGWEEGVPLPRRGHRHSGRGHGHRRSHGEQDHDHVRVPLPHEHCDGRDRRGHGRFGDRAGFVRAPRFAEGHPFAGARPFGPHRGHDMPEWEHRGHGHPDRDRRGHGRRHDVDRAAQRAYERGFDAGYSRGRDA